MFWELPSFSRMFGKLSSFARLILFDRRGSGMSDGIAGATPLEETIDDVQAVIDAAGSEQPVLMSFLEGCGLSSLFAASHPDLVRALVLVSPQARLVSGSGYEWAPSPDERAEMVDTIVGSWGTDSPANPLASLLAGGDESVRSLAASMQRLAMSPAAAAAALETIGKTDVRDVLGSVQCPTLVLRIEGDTYLDERHSDYVAGAHPRRELRRGSRRRLPLGRRGGSFHRRNSAFPYRGQAARGQRPGARDRPVHRHRQLYRARRETRRRSLAVSARAPRQDRQGRGRAPPRALREVSRRRCPGRIRRPQPSDQQRHSRPRPGRGPRP